MSSGIKVMSRVQAGTEVTAGTLVAATRRLVAQGKYQRIQEMWDPVDIDAGVFDPVRPQVSAWSPDRRHVAFASLEGSLTSIYLMNADGSGQSVVHRTDGNAVALHWFP